MRLDPPLSTYTVYDHSTHTYTQHSLYLSLCSNLSPSFSLSLIQAHTHTHTHTRVRARTHTPNARKHTHQQQQAHTQTNPRKQTHTHTHTHTQALFSQVSGSLWVMTSWQAIPLLTPFVAMEEIRTLLDRVPNVH